MSFIRIENLSHVYQAKGRSPVRALESVNLTVDPGEYLAVVGANGSGKTTLALHLNGILLPTQGVVTVDGVPTSDEASMRNIRSRIGMVFQSPEDQMVATVVEEDVAFGPENLGVEEEQLSIRVREALERVDMWDERQRPPHQLSAGQRQRVAIAGALAMNPRCLVLDEATAMLDPAGAREVIRIVSELHREGMTVISVTHKMEEAALAERIVVLSAGTLVLQGSPREVFSHHELSSWRLKAPAISRLAQGLRTHFPAIQPDIYLMEELVSALKHASEEAKRGGAR